MGQFFSDELLASLHLSNNTINNKVCRAQRNSTYAKTKVHKPRAPKMKRPPTDFNAIFPEIPDPLPNEDLNLERMYVTYLRIYWIDLITYPTLELLAEKMRLKPKAVLTIARKYELPRVRSFRYKKK